MDLQFTFDGLETSTVMETYARGQLAKILTFLEHEKEPIFIHLIFKAEPKKDHHKVEILIKTPHYDIVSNYKGPDMYDIIDRVLDIAYRHLLEKKRENVREKKTGDWYKGA